jgi:hypothetical protein
MSNLLEQASLVMIPSGYKEDVVYSEIPLDGSGDLSFTRASNGTRVNFDGLVEVVPWNLAEYSEDFTNAYWTKQQSSISSNATTAPNGTLTADKLVEDTSNSTHRMFNGSGIPISTSDGTTYSFYLKSAGRTRAWVRDNDITGALFNLANGTIVSTEGAATATITSVGDGWYRCTMTRVNSNGSGRLVVYLDNGTSDSYTGDGTSGVFIWGAQLNIGSTAKPYFPTTDRLNVPRLTYQNGGGGCPSLLLEKQSTNLTLWSEDFTQWTASNATVTANNTTSPDGTQNADRIQFTGAGYLLGASQGSGTVYTISCYAKRNGSGTQSIGFFKDGSGTVDSAWALTSDWQRFTYTYTASNGSYSGIAGVNGGDVFVWGAQLEASSYPTSYIPTTSASATRVADVTTKTGIASLIGSTEGVLFVEADMTLNSATDGIFIDVNDNNLTNRVLINISNNVIGGFVQGSNRVSYTIPSSGRYKIAFGYKSGDFVLYVNGVQRSTSSASVTFSGMNQIFLGHTFAGTTTQPSDPIAQAILFKTRLTNAELASLTTI